MNIEHLQPRSRGGSNRISNLVLACVPCNRAKGSRPVELFLADDPGRLERIVEQTRASLRGAAAMNATQQRLTAGLEALGKPVYTWPGALTKANRDVTGLGKTHTLDALSVGPFGHESGDAIVRVPEFVLVVEATGRGSYARTTPDRFGFPRLLRTRAKRHFGYVTGDLVRAVMPTGRWKGHVERSHLRARQGSAQSRHARRTHRRMPREPAAPPAGRRLWLPHSPGAGARKFMEKRLIGGRPVLRVRLIAERR
ncbi:HNH endonuclease [Streptomyces sp. NPDC002766]|uniref:HNH endonuclease n=1 Tax=unclassified Streptomyces TaxID=2593676 RepID=UPI00332D793B